jgi:hypothetical protein
VAPMRELKNDLMGAGAQNALRNTVGLVHVR